MAPMARYNNVMADVKVSELPRINSNDIDDKDILYIVDVSDLAKSSKQMLMEDLGTYIVGKVDRKIVDQINRLVPSLVEIEVFNASDANAKNEASVEIYSSYTGDYLVRGKTTIPHPRFGFDLHESRELVGVYEGGVDVSADFVEVQPGVYVLSYDIVDAAVQYLIRTREKPANA